MTALKSHMTYLNQNYFSPISVMYGAIASIRVAKRNMNNTNEYRYNNMDLYSHFFVDVISAYAYWLLTPTTWWSKQGLYNAGKLSTRIVII